jgi:hypothetical protein
MKKLGLALCTVAAFVVSAANMAQAQHISRNNPYRAFNQTGVNYGAQQWERQMGGYGASGYSSGYTSVAPQTYGYSSGYRGWNTGVSGYQSGYRSWNSGATYGNCR